MSAIETPVETSPPAAPTGKDGPGARLKLAREAAGLSLDQVAQQLKLAPRQVRALEDEDFAQLPGRTFARGFVRNYARLLNLDGNDLLAMLPDPAHAPALGSPALQSTGSTIAELPTTAAAKPSFMRWLIPLVLVGCIVGAAVYEWYRGGASSPTTEAPSPVVPQKSLPAAPGANVKELPNPLAADNPTPEAAAREGAAEVSNAPVPAPSQEPAAQTASVAPQERTAQAAAATGSQQETAAQVAAIAPASVRLTYHGPAWTQVRDRRGQILISRLVAAGSEQAIRGEPPFDVVIGNARAVALVYRDKPVDLSRFTRQGIARLRLE